MTVIAAALAGHLVVRTQVWEKTVLIVSGVMMVYPSIPVSIVGMVLAAVVVVVQVIRRRNAGTGGSDSTGRVDPKAAATA